MKRENVRIDTYLIGFKMAFYLFIFSKYCFRYRVNAFSLFLAANSTDWSTIARLLKHAFDKNRVRRRHVGESSLGLESSIIYSTEKTCDFLVDGFFDETVLRGSCESANFLPFEGVM